MRETITLTQKEQKRLMVLNRIDRGEATVAQAAELLGISERQVHRIHAAYRKEGAAALAHGNRGRTPSNALDPALRTQVVSFAQSIYQGVNHQHLTDLLGERHGIHLHCSTLKRILASAGLKSPRTRRGHTHRSRRERYPQEGMLIQMDGSPHAWLQERGPWLCLLAAIDDATGDVPAACFRDQEDAAGYMLLTEQLISAKGRPLAVYHDRHGIFAQSKTQRQTIEEELAGTHVPTQVERMLEELAITSIAAQSPQAKGRIERLFGTFQDRLVTELRLTGIRTLDEANEFLPSFLARFNHKFQVPAAQEGSAYRRLEPEMHPETIFCFKYVRTVGIDNIVRFMHHRLQVEPSHGRMSYAKARVSVHERLNGSLAVYYHGQCLVTTEAPLEAPLLRARPGQRRPAPDHEQDHVTVVEDVGMLAANPASSARNDPGRQHPHIPRKPASDHPWRQPFKQNAR
jgi:transposase